VLRFKKKWYKNNVESTFDTTTSVGESQSSAPVTSTPAAPSADAAPRPPATPVSTTGASTTAARIAAAARLCALFVSITFCLPFGSSRIYTYAVMLHVVGNVSAIVSKHGMPQFNMEWLQPIMVDDSAVALFFCMVAFPLNRNWLALLSPCITAVMGISDVYTTIFQPNIPTFLDQVIAPYARKVNMKRYEIIQFRANCEVMLGVITFVLAILGRASFMTVLLYGNALRTAYQMSAFTQGSFTALNASITKVLSNFIPVVVPYYTKACNFIHNYASPHH